MHNFCFKQEVFYNQNFNQIVLPFSGNGTDGNKQCPKGYERINDTQCVGEFQSLYVKIYSCIYTVQYKGPLLRVNSINRYFVVTSTCLTHIASFPVKD